MIQKKGHINRYTLIIGFLLLLILPNLVMLSGLETTMTNENKKITKLPDFNLTNPKRLVSDYKSYYENNFGLRTSFVNTYLSFKTNILKENPLPHQVIKGEEGWYFLGNAHSDILNDTFGNVPFTNADLNAITVNLENIERYLSSKQIKFYLVVPPNKQTIYQEKLPFQLNQNTKRLEQLQNHLNKHSTVQIISLEKRLLSEKKQHQLFYKTDTHWNDYGAFLGYTEVIKAISHDFKIAASSLSDYHLTTIPFTGDITPMINKHSRERSLKLEKKPSSIIDTLSKAYTFQHYKNDAQDLKLIMHCDSFSDAWIPFFNETFNETVFVRTFELDYALIEKIQPDIVILEIIERNLMTLTNKKNL